MKCSKKTNSLKKDEGVALLIFEGGPGVPFLNFEILMTEEEERYTLSDYLK